MWHRLTRQQQRDCKRWIVRPTWLHDAVIIAVGSMALVAMGAVVAQPNPYLCAVSPIFALILTGAFWFWRHSRRSWSWSLDHNGLIIEQPGSETKVVQLSTIVRFAHVPYVPPPSEGLMPEGGFVRVILTDSRAEMPEIALGLAPRDLSELAAELNAELRSMDQQARTTKLDPNSG